MKKRTSSTGIILLLVVALAAAYFFTRSKDQPQEPVPGPVTGKLTARFLDVGQGDCQLLQLPGGETVLIDSGDSGVPTVDMLKQFGVREIDLIIATHPHQDHIGEMRNIMRAFNVKEVLDSGFPHSTRTYATMLEEIKARGIKFSTPRRGDTRSIGDVKFEIVNPRSSDEFIDESPNNASVVVRVTFGANTLLFTGDAEVAAWADMMKAAPDRLRADLLKAAHHGSSNGMTKEILDAVRPSICVISCKVGNDYHHPHPRVVNLLEQRRRDIRLYRTDIQGTITAVCDGKTIEMSTDKQIGQDQLYLTGDETAGKVASDGGESQGTRKRGAGRSR